MDIKCVPLAEASAPRLYRKLLKVGRDNNLTDLSLFYGEIIDTLFKAQPNLKTRFELDRKLPEDYIYKVSSMIKGMLSSVESKILEETGEHVTTFTSFVIANPVNVTLRDNLSKSLMSRIEVLNNPFSISLDDNVEDTITPEDNIVESAEGESYTAHQGELVDFLEERARLKMNGELESNMSRDAFASMYFKGMEELFSGFKTYVMSKFYNNLVHTEVVDGNDPLGYNTDMNQVIYKTQEDIKTEASNTANILLRYRDEMSGDLSEEIIQAYYASVANIEFDNVIALNINGVKVSEEKVYSVIDSSSTVRKSYSDVDGSFSQTDQASPLTKLHITNTPRLTRDSRNNLVKSTTSDFLTDYEISAIADDLNNLPQELPLFRRGLKNLADRSGGVKSDTFLSLYYRFFSDESYTVDNIERFSISMLASMNNKQAKLSNNIISSLLTFFTSAQSSDRLSIINNKIVATTTNNTELGANIPNDYSINIQHPGNPAILKKSISDNIALAEEADGTIVIRVGKSDIIRIPKGGIDISGKHGHIVKLGKEKNESLNSTSVAVGILKNLGFPSYVSNKFIDHYKYNIGDIGKDVDVPTMLANFAYMIAINTKDGYQFLSERNLAVSELPKDSNEGVGLKYPPFKHAYIFKAPFVSFLEYTTGIQAKKLIKNVGGDIVATVSTSHVFGRTKQLLDTIRKTEGSVHENNILVNRNSGWVLEGFLDKDGIIVRGKSKKVNEMTMSEHYKFLIEDSFLRYGYQSNFTKAIFQPGAMADRGRVPAGIYQSTQGFNFLPRDYKVDTDQYGLNSLQRDLRDSEMTAINAQEKMIVKEWVDQLNDWISRPAKWKTFTQGDINKINSLETLQEFLDKAKIPLANVRRSIKLVNELMYVPNGDTVRIKKAIIHMKSVWNNPESAKKFMEVSYSKFRYDLNKSGYGPNIMSRESAKILLERFNSATKETSFDIMTEAYFYRSVMMSNATLTLNAGSFLQFPGDMKDMSNDFRIIDFAKSLLVDGKLSEENKLKVKEAAEALSINQAMHDMMTPQSKRNSLITSGAQRPRLYGKNEEGKGLGLTTNTVMIVDPKEIVKLLGDLSGELTQEVYDAAQLVHPLYLLKLNESVGSEASGFMTHGGAVKDLSVETDPRTGVNRSQKKASFNSFAMDLLAEGTPESHRLFYKMNTAIKYNGREGINIDKTTLKIVPEATENTFNVKHLQDLWEYYGGVDNANSWVEVLEVLGKNPEIREKYVEKVGFKSGEKTGNRAFNKSDVWNNDNPESNLVYTEYSNIGHGIILSADHDPDVSNHESDKALMTQIISAAVLQGETADIAAEINKSLLTLSEIGLNRVTENVRDVAVSILRARVKDSLIPPNLLNEVSELIAANDLMPTYGGRLDEIIDELDIKEISVKEYVRKLTEEAITIRESAEITKDLVRSDKSALDSMQLYKAVHSAVMAEINRSTTRVKFKGQEFVVSASYDFIKLYELDGELVSRVDYMKSDKAPEKVITDDYELAAMTYTDIVVFEDERMSLQKAIRLAGSRKALKGRIKGKVPGPGRQLKWASYNYTTNTGETVYIENTQLYKDLYSTGIKLASKTITDEEKKVIRAERKLLETKLKELFEDTSILWNTTDAEFFMPMTHAKVYNLNKPGTNEPDSSINISDIVGTTKTGVKIYLKNGNIVTTEEESDMHIFQSEYNSMIKFFKKRILNNKRDLGFEKMFRRFSSEMTLTQLRKIIDDEAAYGNSLESNSLADINSMAMITIMDKIEYDLSLKEAVGELNADDKIDFSLINELNKQVKKNRENYIQALAEKQARSFPKTLTIFAARIPAQGKQSGIVGKVKGFITSNRNAIFGPAEMLKVTGADHDIDKSHVLVYSTDEEGALYDYSPYLDDKGNISIDKYNKIVADKIKKMVNLSKHKKLSEDVIVKKIATLKARENKKLEEATKNRVLDKLALIWRHPKNAVEAATPISIEELQDELASKDKAEGKIIWYKGHPIISSDAFVSPYTPSSIPMLERINAIGKGLVGINATGIKGFAAITTAALSDMDNENMAFPDEKIPMFKGNETAEKVYSEVVGNTDNNTINLYTLKGGKFTPESRKYIANTDKFSDSNKVVENNYKSKVERLKSLGKTEQEIDKELLNDADKLMVHGWKQDDQAWNSLSQLLSAATDNAKELLLGRLGIDMTTNGLVVAGITVGFKIKDILTLLDNPEVKAFIKVVEDSNDTTKTTDKSLSLDSVLSKYMVSKYGKKNEKLIKKIYDSQSVADKMGSVKFDSKYANEVREESGAASEKDLKFIYPGNFDKFKNDAKSSTVSKNPMTIEEKETLHKLLSNNPKINLLGDVNLTPDIINSVFRVITSSNNLIVGGDPSVMNSTINKLVLAYAQEFGKSVHSVSNRGTWKVYRDGKFVDTDATPIITTSTGLIFEKFHSSIEKAINNAVIATSSAFIMDDAEYNESVDKARDKFEADKSALEVGAKTLMEEFLLDPPRQVLQLVKIADEMRAVSTFLSINQGTPNDSLSAFNFFNGFIKLINKADGINLGPKAAKNFIKSLTGELEEETSGDYARMLIETYNKHKVGLNPFYIISKNDHYLGYLKSFLYGQDLIRTATFTDELVEELIYTKTNTDSIGYDSMSEITNFVYGVGVDLFLKQVNKRALPIDGTTYNLTTNYGRSVFLKDMVSITNKFRSDDKLKSNAFIKYLLTDTIKDNSLNSFTEIVKTRDLSTMSAHAQADMKLGLAAIKSMGGEYAKFHDALFYYTLIMNKGAIGKSSFSALFGMDTEGVESYNVDFLGKTRERKVQILEQVSNMGEETFLLNNPTLIPSVSTKDKEPILSDDEIEARARFAEEAAEMGFFEQPDLTLSSQDEFFTMPESHKYIIFKSLQTNKVYSFLSEEERFVVVTPKYPSRGIPYTTGKTGIEAAGWQYGETVKVNSNGVTGQVLYYDYESKSYVVTVNGVKKNMTDLALSPLNPTMIFREGNFGEISFEDINNKLLAKTLSKPKEIVTANFDNSKSPRLSSSSTDKFKLVPLVDYKHLSMVDQAHAVMGFDVKSANTNKSEGEFKGTEWIKKYKEALGDVDLSEVNSSEKIMFYGSRLEDGVNPDEIKNMFNVIKPYIDHVASKGAEILVGNSTGVDEEIRSYIVANYPLYVYTDLGFKVGQSDVKEGITLWKSGPAVGRFNSNNTLNREKYTRGSSFGTVLYKTPSESKTPWGSSEFSEYQVKFNEDRVVSWNASVDSDVLLNMIFDSGVTRSIVGSNNYSKIQNKLIVLEEEFVQRMIAEITLESLNKSKSFTSLNEFESYVWNMRANDSEFDSLYMSNISKMLDNSGVFNLDPASIVAMSRNRDITLGYINEILKTAEIIEKPLVKLNNFELLNNSRVFMEKTREYLDMVNEGTITQEVINKIKSGNITYRDAYNLIRTYSPNKVFSKDMVIDGEIVNRLFRRFGVDAFSLDNGYIILDNDSINSLNEGDVTQMDSADVSINNYKLSSANNKWNSHKTSLNNTPSDVVFHKEPVMFRDLAGKNYASKMVSRSVISKVFAGISANTNVNAVTMSDLDIAGEYGIMYSGKPGFTTSDGKVVINLDHATLDTPIHEFGHVYLAHLKATNVEVYNNIIEQSLNHDIRNEIEYLYKGSSEEQIGAEIFTTLLGIENQVRSEEVVQDKPMTKWQKILKAANEASSIIDFFNRAFNTIFGTSKPYTATINDSLADIIEGVGTDLLTNKNSVLNNLSTIDKKNIKKVMNDMLDEDQIRVKLTSMNFIQKICI